MDSIIIRSWNGKTIRQREDGYLSLTDMAHSCNKLIGNWTRLKSTNDYLQALQGSIQMCIDQIIQVNESCGTNEERGTWGHRILALEFARWLSPEFAIQCNQWIEELLTKGTVSLVVTPAVIPQTYLEALKALVAAEEEKERLEQEKKLLETMNQDLDTENHRLSEVVDELFDYSSIIRIAKFNNVSEKQFSWHKLKAQSKLMGVEVKVVPCPRFVTKNLYSHDVWRACYPKSKLPETLTITVSHQN